MVGALFGIFHWKERHDNSLTLFQIAHETIHAENHSHFDVITGTKHRSQVFNILIWVLFCFIHCADWLHFQTRFYTSVQNNSLQSYVCSVWAAYYTNCMCIAGVKFLILYWSHYILGHCKTIYLLWNAFTVVPIKMVIGASVLANRDYESDLEYSSLKSG